MRKYTERNKGELEKKSLRLFKGDAAFIDEHFPNAGHSIIIRKLVRDFRLKVESKINQKEQINADSFIDGIADESLAGSGEGKPE